MKFTSEENEQFEELMFERVEEDGYFEELIIDYESESDEDRL